MQNKIHLFHLRQYYQYILYLFTPSCAEPRLFWVNWVIIIGADFLVPQGIRSSAGIILTFNTGIFFFNRVWILSACVLPGLIDLRCKLCVGQMLSFFDVGPNPLIIFGSKFKFNGKIAWLQFDSGLSDTTKMDHMQNFVMITVLEFEWDLKKIASNLNYYAKIVG